MHHRHTILNRHPRHDAGNKSAGGGDDGSRKGLKSSGGFGFSFTSGSGGSSGFSSAAGAAPSPSPPRRRTTAVACLKLQILKIIRRGGGLILMMTLIFLLIIANWGQSIYLNASANADVVTFPNLSSKESGTRISTGPNGNGNDAEDLYIHVSTLSCIQVLQNKQQ